MLTRRLTWAFVTAVLLTAFTNAPADARQHRKSTHHTHHYNRVHMAASPAAKCDDRYPMNCGVSQNRQERRTRVASDEGSQIVSHPSGCPWRQFCGCGVSVKVFGRPVRDLFLAANWRKFPPASPGPGMVAWRYGHVMYIMSANGDGTATVYDPNSGGHQTRIHTRSLAGYRVVNPHGSLVAMR